jgi:hypothetical protein
MQDSNNNANQIAAVDKQDILSKLSIYELIVYAACVTKIDENKKFNRSNRQRVKSANEIVQRCLNSRKN